MPLAPVISAHWDEPDSFTLEGYRRHGGYDTIAPALAKHPDEIIQAIKDSGLRGRGGAGFPTGMKWGFVPQGDGKPHYLVINADESEPGACKDVPILLANPHALIEGMITASFAIRAARAFIYIRGEVPHVIRRVDAAVREAYAAGFLGQDILGSGFDLDITVHAGAGAYICGEETALLDSLEGFRGQPRLKPPFPAVAGLYASPTVVNNVETIASVPSILTRGAEWFRGMGTEKSPGFKMFAVSGHVATPRRLRDGARLHAARAARPRRWRPRGPRAEVLAPRRLVGPVAHRRAPRHPADLRGHERRRHVPRHGDRHGLRRDDERRCAPPPAGSSSTSTSPAASARRAARVATGSSS